MKFGAKEKDTYRLCMTIGVMLVISRVIMWLVYLLWSHMSGDQGSFAHAFFRWDAGWYKSIIESGYSDFNGIKLEGQNGAANWAFFPLMPAYMVFLRKVLPSMGLEILGFLANTAIFGIALFAGSRYILLTRPQNGGKAAFCWLFIMCFGPYSFYYSSLYTESIYLLCLCLCFYFLEQEQYIKLGVCGIFLSASRNTGVLFVFAILTHSLHRFFKDRMGELNPKLLWEYVKKTLNDHKLILGTCMCPLGLFLYMLHLYFLVGDPMAFAHVQRAWGKEITNPAEIVLRTLGAASRGAVNQEAYFLLFIVIGACLLGWLFVQKHYTEFVLGCIFLVVPLSTGIASIPRYMVGGFVFYLALADGLSGQKRYLKGCLLAVLGVIELWLTYGWFSTWGFLT